MKFIQVIFLVSTVTLTSLTLNLPLPELWRTLTSLQNRSAQLVSQTLSAAPIKPVTFQLLKTEIEKSLQNKDASNLNSLFQTQNVKTAKYLIEAFFSHGIENRIEREHTSHYILFIAAITGFLKEKFGTQNLLTLLSITGMKDPMEYAYLIFALDDAGFKTVNLIILGDIDNISKIDSLKAYINHERTNQRLKIKPEIQYYETIPEFLNKEHRINFYLYKLRPSKPLMRDSIKNAMICKLNTSQDVARVYFLDKEIPSYMPVQNASEFIITQDVKSINDMNRFMDEMRSYPSPVDIITPYYSCSAIEEEIVHISKVISKTKTKNIVPFLFYTDSELRFLELPTRHMIDSIAALIHTRTKFLKRICPKKMTIYKWDNPTAQYAKYKDIG